MKPTSPYCSVGYLATLCVVILSFTLAETSRAQPDDPDKPVILQAEAGTIGSAFDVLEDEDTTYVSVQSDWINLGNPGSDERVLSLEVTFPEAGMYNLFARVRVGPGAPEDDSFFYGSGFGTQDATADADWVVANNLHTAGFTHPDQFVTGLGNAQPEVWKWINLSENNLGEAPVIFTVGADSLTQTFQIGAREDGLDIDQLAFGRSDLYYTVANLENVEAGSAELPGDSLSGPIAEGHEKFLGNIYSSSQLQNFENYWNQVTPENAGKWGSVEGTRDVMNWGSLDAAYDLAKDNGFPFRYHVLVWGNQQPGWIESLPPDEQLEEIEEWFSLVADRYPDIDYLEVVNEPLHDPPVAENGNYIEALGGMGETGWDWVLNAFRLAREHFPDTRLMINDYNILGSPNNTQQYLEIIELLQAEDLIDGIGVQGHAFSTRGSPSIMTSNLDLLATTGLPIQVTEFDVDGPTDEVQLQDYQRIFPALWEHPAVEGITLWGWKPGLWRTEQGAYLVRADGTERPALEWLREYVEAQSVPVDRPDEVPKAFSVVGNYPNPFKGSTSIRYDVAETARLTLKVYDSMGRLVQTLVDEVQSPGRYTARFRAGDLASGTYLYRLETASFTRARPMILIK